MRAIRAAVAMGSQPAAYSVPVPRCGRLVEIEEYAHGIENRLVRVIGPHAAAEPGEVHHLTLRVIALGGLDSGRGVDVKGFQQRVQRRTRPGAGPRSAGSAWSTSRRAWPPSRTRADPSPGRGTRRTAVACAPQVGVEQGTSLPNRIWLACRVPNSVTRSVGLTRIGCPAAQERSVRPACARMTPAPGKRPRT